jgi:hypothetical protein
MFSIGDTVKVTKKIDVPPSYSLLLWIDEMDETIGEEFIIEEIDTSNRVVLLDNYFWYHEDALEKIKENIMEPQSEYNYNEISEYIRNNKGVPYGLLIGRKIENRILITFSVCNPRDTFSKIEARKVALERMRDSLDCEIIIIPDSICNKAKEFSERCERYFQTEDFYHYIFKRSDICL